MLAMLSSLLSPGLPQGPLPGAPGSAHVLQETDAAALLQALKGYAARSAGSMNAANRMPSTCTTAGGVRVNMESARVLQNNLGGIGPDAGEPILRISKVGRFEAGGAVREFDVVYSSIGPYSAPHGYKNNGVRGEFAVLSVQEGTYATIRASFVDSKTGSPLAVPSLSLVNRCTWKRTQRRAF